MVFIVAASPPHFTRLVGNCKDVGLETRRTRSPHDATVFLSRMVAGYKVDK